MNSRKLNCSIDMYNHSNCFGKFHRLNRPFAFNGMDDNLEPSLTSWAKVLYFGMLGLGWFHEMEIKPLGLISDCAKLLDLRTCVSMK